MKRTIARIAAATLTAAAMLGTTSVMAVPSSWDVPEDFDYEAYNKVMFEAEKEREKHLVDPEDPMIIRIDWKYAPNNPLNRSGIDKLSASERAELYELSNKMFMEIHGDELRKRGLEINTVEEKELFFSGLKVGKGDVNFDGKQNAKDVIAAMKIMLDIEGAPDLQFYLADINSDGKVNAKDVAGMMKAMLG